MGIDAEFFLSIKGNKNHIKADEILKHSVRMSKALGHEHFFIQDEEGKKNPRWGKWHHAMSIVDKLSAKEAKEGYMTEEHAGKVVWQQDGEPYVAEKDEQLVRIHVWGRYYDEGYARGNWSFYRTLYAYCRIMYPEATLYYGGDSSGVTAEPLTEERVRQIDEYFFVKAHSEYVRGFSNIFTRELKKIPECPVCETAMTSNGGGQGTSFFYCQSCSYKGTANNKTGEFTKEEK